MTQKEEGHFTLATRIFLTPTHRERLQLLVLEQGIDLPELLSDLLATYLDELPEEAFSASEPQIDVAAELNQRRAELRRVRARQQAAGAAAPTWLASYITELEAEIARLEQVKL